MMRCYIVDSSSLVDINRHTPIDIFPALWNKLSILVRRDILISHEEVFNEITKQDGMLTQWAKKNKQMFRRATPEQSETVKEVLKKYPTLIKVDRTYDADPWLIALTKELKDSKQKTLWEVNRLIVTEEKIRGKKVRIPYVCNDYGIDCIDRIEMFRKEGWKF
jgi:hypothetical protein